MRRKRGERLVYALGASYSNDLTRQFMLEDHAIRHSYHHLARL
jgi:hypothetical protein